MNVSQIARKHGVEGTGLANFMRIHEPEVIPWREKVRHWLGINDNTHRGATPACTKQYAEAVELYKKTDMTIPEIAGACHVSPSGFKQHLRFYHKIYWNKRERNVRKHRPDQRRREANYPATEGPTNPLSVQKINMRKPCLFIRTRLSR